MTEPREKILAVTGELGLALDSVFVPFSKSRSREDTYERPNGVKYPNHSLNWLVTLKLNDKPILTTDYKAGNGHCPSSKKPPKTGSHLQHEAIKFECEHGRTAHILPGGEIVGRGRDIQPDICDVLHSLTLDADVLNYSDFEDWASNFGYDTDSREAEKIYQACLKIALALRNSLGEEKLVKL